MTIDEFWQLIERSRIHASDCETQAEALTALLRALRPEEIAAFERELTACLTEAYRWDLWGVAYLVNGGCSDDLFVYFRLWLVGQGREYFEHALREPERAADRAVPYESDCEDLLYAGRTAHLEATGEDLPRADEGDPREPAGDPWTEDDLPRRFPVVAARFA